MKISEIFESIQGEGRYLGRPMLFIRTSGCTRKCAFCDTKYHNKGENYSLKELIKIINKSKLDIVCFTGGEPLLWYEEIKELRKATKKDFHIETNGDILKEEYISLFNYISCSPKELSTAKKIKKMSGNIYIKIVTDLKTTGVDMIKYATTLMPLSTFNSKKDKEIKQKVWDYCVKNKIEYSPRVHVDVWGNKKNI